MEYSRGLISYTTENAAQGKGKHIWRPRVIVYAIILSLLCGALFWHISQRVALDLDVIRDRNSLYRETRDGLIENVYTLKILNMDDSAHRYELRADGIEQMKLVVDDTDIEVAGGTISQLVVRIQADESFLKQRSTAIRFYLQAVDANHLNVSEEARFLGPGS